MILTEKEQIVPKPEEEVAQKKKVESITFLVSSLSLLSVIKKPEREQAKGLL